jgi:hypothetical protein
VLIDHYRKQYLCRASYAFPSAKYRALGKESFAESLRSAKIGSRQIQVLPRARRSANIGSRQSQTLPRARLSVNKKSRQSLNPHKRHPYAVIFAESLLLGSRQNIFFAESLSQGSRQFFFWIFGPKFFVQPCYSTRSQDLKFGVFSIPLAIFYVFFSFS